MFKVRTGPALRAALAKWLAAEEQPMGRLEALRVVQAVCDLAEQVREQRVIEARSFRRTWSEIAAAVGVTRQSAHRRWRHVDPAAEALAAEREQRFRPRSLPAAPPAPAMPSVPPEQWESWRP